MSKTSLVPKKIKHQLIKDQKTVKGKLVFDEKKPYYVLKVLTESEGFLFTEYYSSKTMAVSVGDAEEARECCLSICNLAVEECANGATKVDELGYMNLFTLSQKIITTNLISGSDLKK